MDEDPSQELKETVRLARASFPNPPLVGGAKRAFDEEDYQARMRRLRPTSKPDDVRSRGRQPER